MSPVFVRLWLVLLMLPIGHQWFVHLQWAEPTSFSIPNSVSIEMHELNADGSPRQNRMCNANNQSWGCTAFCDPAVSAPGAPCSFPIRPYPYPSTTYDVLIDGWESGAHYLRDVVAQETNPEAFHERAVWAQAIASRTYAYWYARYNLNIDNTTNKQVFVPYRYASKNASYGDFRPIIDQAVSNRHYLSRDVNDDPIFAQFFDDHKRVTGDGGYPYLKPVQDPISYPPYAADTSLHWNGLNQKGASRWARGNPQYNANDPSGPPWSVAWQNPLQILTHYYTDIHVRDADANNTILTPNRRWSALEIESLPAGPVSPATSHYF